MTDRRQSRRKFLKETAAYGGVLIAAGNVGLSLANTAQPPQDAAIDWTKKVGLELFTVRDLIQRDYEGTLAKVAEIGYREVEPASNYADLEPKQFRALLDRYGLSMPSTHVAATDGPDLEKQLEGFQIMGIQYADIRTPRPAGRLPGGPGGVPRERPAETVESVKRAAEEANRKGNILKKFGMKMHIHNHTEEFQPCEGSHLRPYDILLAETDPDVVVMQIDIGWAAVAGQNVLEMFRKNPGRFVLWHVKDAFGMKLMPSMLTMSERRNNAMLVPIGQGEVDYRPIFASAALAGMKHFVIEQDNADAWGDSMAAAQVNYRNFVRMLSADEA